MCLLSDPMKFCRDIQKATKNFTTILGQGSFGPVYKATMPAGGVVAVKALAEDSKQGEKEFQTEVITVSLKLFYVKLHICSLIRVRSRDNLV